MDNAFCVLQKKEVYEFLEGSGDQELVQHEGTWYARQHGEFEAIWLTTC